MADTAAHLVDRVLPETPVRQWVLSLPHSLRYRLAYDTRLTSDVLRIFVRRVFASLRRRAGVKYQGIVCASVLLERPLAGFYVTNILDDGMPFTGVIESRRLWTEISSVGGR